MSEKVKNQKTNNRFNSRKFLYRMILTAVFTALALVCKILLSFTVPLFGTGMRIGLTGVFTFFPAALCGPIYGGIASGLCDLLGCLIKPDGAYIPWLTVTAFCGGVIKGLLWMFFTKKLSKKLRISVVIVFAVIAIVAGTFHISLIKDRIIINGIFGEQYSLNSRGINDSRDDYSVLSKAILSLAKYNNDIFTVTDADDSEYIELPTYVSADGYVRPITKIGAKAFSDCTSLKKIYIPSTVTTIDAKAFDGLDLSAITIVSDKNNKVAEFASKNKIAFEIEVLEPTTVDYNTNVDSKTFTVNGITIKDSDTYRKNLALYINASTVWVEIASTVVILYVVIDGLYAFIISRKKKDTAEGTEEKKNIFKDTPFVKVALCSSISGMIVTTANTEILKIFIAAYSGRAFIILWIPRLIEEFIVCIIQAFAIAILLDVYNRTLSKKFNKILK